MVEIYILIMITSGGHGARLLPASFQEFGGSAACQFAARLIKEKHQDAHVYCVPKGMHHDAP